MAAVSILTESNIDSGWVSSDMGENNGAYLVAIKGTAGKTDPLPIEDLRYMTIEVGIDSGIESHPIPVQRVSFRFDSNSDDEALNNVATLGQLPKLPKAGTFFRVVAFSDTMKEYKSGKMPVSINIGTI